MPMLSKTEVGMVIAIWGQAWVRGADGLFRALKPGDTVRKGAMVLTAQDAIVQIADDDTPTVAAKTSPKTDADLAIEGINKGSADTAPAAGLGGGGGGALEPGLRVDRITEVASTPEQPRGAGTVDAPVEPEFLSGDAPPVKTITVDLPASTVDAVEQGPNVNVGLTVPAGATQIRVDGVPAVGQLLLADGTVVHAGSTLTPAQAAGMVYAPPADYLPGTPTGDLRYSTTVGATNAVGTVGFGITAVNDAPVATAGAVSGNEDTTIALALAGTDVDSPIAGVTIQQLPSNGTLLLSDGVTAVMPGQTLTPTQAAALLYRPDPDYWGRTSISFTVTDDQGASSTPSTWTLTVTAVDDLPVVGADTFTVAEDGSTTINVLANDADPESNALTVTLVNGTPIVDGGAAVAVLHGSVQLVGGQLIFTPAPNYNGPINFTYTASDGALSAAAAVTGTVTAVADAPVANADTFTVAEDSSVTLSVLGNDSDPDGGTLTVTQVNGSAIVDGGAAVAVPGGSVQLTGGQLLFAPAPNTNGPVGFSYTVSNGSISSTGAVSGAVTPVDDASTVNLPAAQSGVEDTPLVFSSANGNALGVSNVDGDTLTVTVAVNHGSFTLGSTAGVGASGNGSASVTLSGGAAAINAALAGSSFNPDADFNGSATLALSVNDGTTSSAASVPIAVAAVADIVGDAVTTNEDTPLAINVLANDSFEGTSPAVVAVDGQAIAAGGPAVSVANGSVALNALGQLVFTPALNYNNTPASPTTFSYTVSSGGVTETATVAVAVTPVPDVATVSLAATPSVAEGGAIVYTATLTSPAFSAVSVTLSNGASITINAGATSGSVSVSAPGDDVYVDAGSVSSTISSAAGGGFDLLNVDATPGTTSVTDTIDTSTVSLTASPAVAEGGSITYTASLNAVAQTPVTVALSNGATITIAAGASSGTANVAAPGDDVVVDAATVSATITSASGGNFEALAVNPAAATTAVSDTIDTTTVSLGASPSVAEGGSIVYTASLTSAAQSPVTVALSNGAVITIAAGASSGSVSVAAPGDDVYADAGSVAATITAASGGNFEALAINPAAATTSITDTIDATTVSLTASAAVAEGGSITYTASLTAAAASPVSVTLSNGATITIAAGASSGSVSVAAPGDDVYVDAGSVSATISAASGGDFETLVVDPAAATTAVSDTIDTATVGLSATPSVAEGGSIVYTASLTSAAQSPVTVTLSNGATISIAAGASTGSVSVAAPGDDVVVDAGNVSATISSATGGNFEALAVNPAAATTAITDTTDVTTVSLTATPSVAEGGSIVYTASLGAAAQTPVTVTLSNGATISIAAGASSGTVSVAAPGDDVYVDAGSVSTTITGANGGNFESLGVNPVPAVTAISDTIDTTTVSITGAASVVEGSSAAYTVSLTSAAQSAVTVNLAYSGTATNGVDYSGVVSVTIAAGTSSTTFNIATLDDALAEGAEHFSVSLLSATGGNFENLAISGVADSVGTTIVDNDTALIAVSDTAVVEGGFAVFTVSLSTPSAGPVTFAPTLASGTATVGTDTDTALEYFNGIAWVPVTGAGVTLAAGITSVQVRVATIDDPTADSGETFTLTASVTAGLTGNTSATGTATITDEAAPDVTVVSLAATPAVAEGGSIVYTASLSNAANSPVTVTLDNGATITIATGASSGQVTVAAPGDDVYADAGSVAASISSATGGGFESLVANTAPAVTTVSDTIDATTVSLTATPTVAEGGSIVYTASLTSAAASPVTVNLSNGATITIAAGASIGTTTVAAPADDTIIDAGSVSTTISNAAGGNFENLVVNPAPAVTAVTDTIDTTVVALTATSSVAEGGSIVYVASLTSVAATAVTVTLSNGSTIAIAAGANSGSVSVNAPGDDVYVDAGNVSASISSASGGNFENLAIDPAAAVTHVTDTIDTTTVSLTATPSVAEGGTIVYTASLTAPAQSAVTVALQSGATITIAAGSSNGSVSVPAPADDVYSDAGSVADRISTATGGGFENLAVNPAPAVTTISDTIDITTVSLTATPSVAEGGSIVYTASLTSVALSPVTVQLANGATINIAAGSSSGSVSVAAPGDDVYVDAGSVSTTIASASGGTFEGLMVNPAAATTSITDTIDASTVSLTATPSVAEGGSIVYTASLTVPALSAVTVTLSNGASITIAAGASTGSVSVAAPGDDVYVDASTVSAAISTATGGGFEQLAIDSTPANTAVTDTINSTTVSLNATPSVAEGGTIVYTASLTALAQTAVTVTLDNGATITIAAGASSGSATVAAPSDDVYLDAGSVSATISSATGGNFENLIVSPAPAVTTVSDTIDVTTVSLTATPSVAEGGVIVYTASLTHPADTPVAVTLNNGATITIAAGASTGTASVAAPGDDVYVDAGSVSASISSATGGNFELLVVNPAAATTSITDTIDVTTVSLTATPSVAEGGTIVYTASLTQPADTAVAVTLSNGATITIAAGASSGTVNVAAPGDDVYVDAGSVSATITAASGGNFEALAINPAPATTAVSDTIDVTTVSLTATPSVSEGGAIVYTASLTSAAASPVTVNLSNGATITIAAGASSGSASVAAPSDDVYLDAGSVSATISSATGGNFESLVVNPAPATTSINDTIDTTTVSLTATPSVAEGGSIAYTASLTSAAASPVTVNLSNGATITIATGASSGTATVAAPADDTIIDAGSVSATISNAAGGNFESLVVNPAPATTSITDTIDDTTVSLTATPSVAEGGSIVYTASLTSAALTPVTVTLSNGATITIAAGASSGSVSMAAPGDDVYLDAGSVAAHISNASGGNFENLVVNATPALTTITDTIDITTVSLASTPSVAEGGFIVYTASLTAAAQTPVTVNLSNGAAITIAAGAASGTASVAAPGDDVYLDAGSVSATITSATGGNFESLAISPAAATTAVINTIDITTVSLTATPSVAEGGVIVYTASLTSAAASPVTVTLSNGATITIAAGASSGTVNVAAPNDDVYVDAGSVSTTISNASGGNFEALAINPTVATTSITDTVDTTTVSLTATPSVAEGGTIVYTASLTSAAQTPVTVTLSNGATITIAAGASSGSVSMAAPSDDVYLDAGSVSATISSASGGNFESLQVNPAAATTAITDTTDTTTVSLTATPSVAEGGTIIYTASLTNLADTAVTLTLSNGATINIAAGASSGTVSVAAPSDDVYVDAGSVSTTITAASGGNFENLAINPAPATTAVSDTIDVTTVSLTSTPSVAEGGTIVYTASLTSAAASLVTVNLSNGASITIVAGASTGQASVAAPSDDVYVDAGSVSATISSATGGNFESLAINPAPATTAVTDTIDTTTVSLTATPSVAEGGTIVYTATLTHPADTAVAVTLSNGATITIAAGASSGTVNVAAPSDDVYVDAGSVSATITGASGGNFEALAINPAAATTSVSDTIDTTTVSLSATPSVAEGGTIVYTASLTAAALAPVNVTLSNGATITIAAGASTGSVIVNAPGDDVFVDAGSVSASISSATGGNFENLAINPAAATTTVTDTIDTTTVSLSATPFVAEGGSIVYTASLTAVAQTAVTVDLANGATITIAAGASSGQVNVPAPGDDVYVDAGSVSTTIVSASGGNFESLVVNPAAATTAITDTVDNSTVSLTATPSVAEGGSIVYTASLTAAAQSPVTVTLPNGATITIATGASSGQVSVAAPGDDVYADAGNVSATISTATGGNFENLVVNPAAATTAVTDTIDTTTLSLTGSASVAEGATASYTVSLTSPAATAVTVTLAYSGSATDGADYTGVAIVTIPAGASSATFNVATLNDSLAEGAENFTVSVVSASGGNFESLVLAGGGGSSVTTGIVDDDAATLSLAATPTLTEAGGSIVYTATLTQAPVTPLTVTLSNGAIIVIAAGALSGTVNVPVAASDDVYVDPSSISATIAGSSGGGIGVVIDATPAVTAITDTIDDTTVSLSATPSVAEGGSIVYTASLTAAAQTPVSVTLSNGATITIAAGATSGSVSVAAPSDDVYVDAGSVSTTISTATGGNFEHLVVDPAAAATAITDTIDTTTVSVTATPSVAEGGSIVYTASLTSAAQSPVTVTLSNGATITIAAGASSGQVSVAAPSDDVVIDAGSVSATISTATGGNFENLVASPTAATTTITDTIDTTTVSLTASPSVAEGGSIVYTASLTSAGNTGDGDADQRRHHHHRRRRQLAAA